MTPLARLAVWPFGRRRRPRASSRSVLPTGRIEVRPERRRSVGEASEEHLARTLGVAFGDAAEAARLGVRPRPTYRPPSGREP